MRRFLLGAVVAVAVGCCVAPLVADAHTPQVIDSCTGLTVSLTQYEGSLPNNRVTVTVDGQAQSFDFGGSFTRQFPWSQTEPHAWTVAVDANRVSGNRTQYDRTFTGEQDACHPATTTSTTTLLSTTTTEVTPSTTTPTSTSTPTTTSTTSTTTTQAPPTSSTTTSSSAPATSTSAPSTSTPITTAPSTVPSSPAPTVSTLAPSSPSSTATPTSSSSTVALIGEPPVPPPSVEVQPAPSIDGTLPATGMRPVGWGAFWVGAIASAAGVGLLLMARRGDLK